MYSGLHVLDRMVTAFVFGAVKRDTDGGNKLRFAVLDCLQNGTTFYQAAKTHFGDTRRQAQIQKMYYKVEQHRKELRESESE